MQPEFLDRLAMRTGHFQFDSGCHGPLWLDLDALFASPAVVRPVAEQLAQKLAPSNFDAVCGPHSGGAFLAQMIAASLGREFFYTERAEGSYRLPRALRKLAAGRRVAVVDDAINAGSAISATLDELESCGAQPVAIGALFVLGAAGSNFLRGRGLPFEVIQPLSSELWPAAECPLCRDGVPLDA